MGHARDLVPAHPKGHEHFTFQEILLVKKFPFRTSIAAVPYGNLGVSLVAEDGEHVVAASVLDDGRRGQDDDEEPAGLDLELDRGHADNTDPELHDVDEVTAAVALYRCQ